VKKEICTSSPFYSLPVRFSGRGGVQRFSSYLATRLKSGAIPINSIELFTGGKIFILSILMGMTYFAGMTVMVQMIMHNDTGV